MINTNGLHKNKLQQFIEDMTSSTGEGERDFQFDLLRWSEEQPYWCVFACEYGDNKRIPTSIRGAIDIGGHYCLEKDAYLHDVLTLLTSSNWKVEIHSEYFM